jgi:hypothetical protein
MSRFTDEDRARAARRLEEARSALASAERHPMRRNGSGLFRDRNGVDQILVRLQAEVASAEQFVRLTNEPEVERPQGTTWGITLGIYDENEEED